MTLNIKNGYIPPHGRASEIMAKWSSGGMCMIFFEMRGIKSFHFLNLWYIFFEKQHVSLSEICKRRSPLKSFSIKP